VDDRRPGGFQLPAKSSDTHGDDIVTASEVIPPHIVDELGLGMHMTRIQQKVAEQIELLWRQWDGTAGPGHDAGAFVQREICESKNWVVLRPCTGATDHAMDASDSFGEGEGLGDVIVAAHDEASHPSWTRSSVADKQNGNAKSIRMKSDDDFRRIDFG
jgi:hypothetical protein